MTRESVIRASRLVVVLLVLSSYIFAVVALHPTNFFGLTGDDAIYFSSAQALAQNRGYILQSIPGAPTATKYPVLYPWILSWVWHFSPAFPTNLPVAIAITITFGCLFLIIGFFLMRNFDGISDPEALLLTAFCALQPAFLFYSCNLLSDVPFAAFALAAMYFADHAVRPHSRATAVVLCAALAGFSMLLRTFGAPVALGVAIAGMTRRAWR